MLQAAREARGLTQEALAVQAGVPLDTLRSIERGRTRTPGFFVVADLAAAAGMSLDHLRDETA